MNASLTKPSAKIMKAFRLSPETINRLESLQKRYQRSQADVIALLIYADYESLEIGSDEFQAIINSPL